MVNNRGYILHKIGHKKGKIHDYDVYKKNHPVNPKQVVNVLDWIPWCRKRFSRTTIIALPYKKQRNQQELSAEEEKGVQQDSFQCIVFRKSRKVSPLNLSYCLNSCFLPSMLIAPNKHECLCEPVTLTKGLLPSSIQTLLTRES